MEQYWHGKATSRCFLMLANITFSRAPISPCCENLELNSSNDLSSYMHTGNIKKATKDNQSKNQNQINKPNHRIQNITNNHKTAHTFWLSHATCSLLASHITWVPCQMKKTLFEGNTLTIKFRSQILTPKTEPSNQQFYGIETLQPAIHPMWRSNLQEKKERRQ